MERREDGTRTPLERYTLSRNGQIHRFSIHGRRIVLDVNSGALFECDEEAWRLFEDQAGLVSPDFHGKVDASGADSSSSRADGSRSVDAEPSQDFFGSDVSGYAAAGSELELLVRSGLLFSPEPEAPPHTADLPLKALCLNVAHDCNLRCAYCFAGSGTFSGPRTLMTEKVGEAAVDFLIDRSQGTRLLEIDFFGGEPMLNWPVVRHVMRCARERGAARGKVFRFTITTNGVLLTPEIVSVLAREFHNVVMSLDGRPQVNDRMRRFPAPGPSSSPGSVYAASLPRLLEVARARAATNHYVRGTFTRFNLDFAADLMHLVDLGFKNVSVEPVIGTPGDSYCILESHLPQVLDQYDILLQLYLERAREGRPFRFFHFELSDASGPCVRKRITGCGAGFEYLAVAADGEIYPCHQFVGRREFMMGNVLELSESGWGGNGPRTAPLGPGRPSALGSGLAARHGAGSGTGPESALVLAQGAGSRTVRGDSHPEAPADRYRAIRDRLFRTTVLDKPACRACWARFHCGGGCHANAHLVNGDLLEPDRLGCLMMKKRLECAFFAKLFKASEKASANTFGEGSGKGIAPCDILP